MTTDIARMLLQLSLLLEWHAYGAPGPSGPVRLVQRARAAPEDRAGRPEVPRRRRPGSRGVSPSWGGSLARCLSVGDARRGPLPQRRYPAPAASPATRPHASPGPRLQEPPGRRPAPGGPVAAKARCQGHGLPAASLRFAPGRPLTASFPARSGTCREDGEERGGLTG
jgi:hypothetical protein